MKLKFKTFTNDDYYTSALIEGKLRTMPVELPIEKIEDDYYVGSRFAKGTKTGRKETWWIPIRYITPKICDVVDD